jgi:hypothetical protein
MVAVVAVEFPNYHRLWYQEQVAILAEEVN